MRKVKDLIKDLQNMVKLHPESEEFQIIYSHDDEGNEYQRVINGCSFCVLEDPNQKSYRFLELEGFYGEENIELENCNAVIIN